MNGNHTQDIIVAQASKRCKNLPPTDIQPVEQEWRYTSYDLATWAMRNLVNRSDCLGKYYNIGPDAQNCKADMPVNSSTLSAHWHDDKLRYGVYCYGVTGQGTWLCLDIDAHTEAIEENWHHVCIIIETCLSWGITPIVEHTNGKYGFHVWILFDEDVDCAVLRSIGLYLTQGFICEVFPKSSRPTPYGNYVRLPGRHHKRTEWHSEIYNIDKDIWLAGITAIRHLIHSKLNSFDLVPEEAKTFVPEEAKTFVPEPQKPSGQAKESGFDYSAYTGDFRTLDILELSKDRRTYADSGNSYGIVCPWVNEHTSGDTGTCVFVNDDGYPNFNCLHSHCVGRNTLDYLATFDPKDVDACCTKHIKKPDPIDIDHSVVGSMDDFVEISDHAVDDPWLNADKTPVKVAGYQFKPISSKDFAKAEYKMEWLVKGVLVHRQPCVFGGPKKALKTNTLIDLALSLGTGEKFLGEFETRKSRVSLISGESGEFTIQETAKRICQAKGINLEDSDVYWDFKLPKLSVADELQALSDGLKAHGIEVAIIDPLYLCLLSGSDKQASNVFDMGALLLEVSTACLSVGCMPILAHHAKKQGTSWKSTGPLDLEDLAFAGIQEFARQWLLINRRQDYVPGSGTHKMWFSAGGSVGHGGLWGINIEEGQIDDNFCGRKWDVSILTPDEVKLDAHRQKEYKTAAKDQEPAEDMLDLVAEEDYTKSKLMNTLGWSKGKFDRIFAQLEKEKKIRLSKAEISTGKGATRTVDIVTLGS